MIYAALAHLFAVMSPGPDTAIIIREVSPVSYTHLTLPTINWV